MSIKLPAPEHHDGSGLRIGIVHARWNSAVIEPLLEGTKAKLLACGVKECNIVTQSVPGSWELPLAVQRDTLPVALPLGDLCITDRRSSSLPLTLSPLSPVQDLATYHLCPFRVILSHGLILGKPDVPCATGQTKGTRLYSASQVQSSSSGGGTAGDLLGSSTADLSSTSPASSGAFDALIAIGVLIKGETMHFEYISDAVSQGLMRVSLDTGVPVIFGVLTVMTEDQARARAGLLPGSHNHGEDWGLAAVELAVKRKGWAAGKLE